MYDKEALEDSMEGPMNIRFKAGITFQQYCAMHIVGFDPDKLEILAVRLFYGDEITVTVYAAEKQRQDSPDGTIPVRKFKLQVDFLKDIMAFVETCNFTLSTGHYPLDQMRIVNK